MDLVDLILLLVFAGFPLLQFVLERLGGKKPPPPPDLDWPDDPEVPAFPGEPRAQQTATLPEAAPDRWSESADAWSAETLESLASEEVVTEQEANELIALQERAASLRIPEATRVHVPVVSLESLQIDRKEEHGRFHRLVAPPPPVVRTSAATTLRASLLSPRELRRAVILTEVLGPPVSLR